MAKILIIEDEPSLQRTLFDVLTHDGFKVFQATDGAAGFELARNERPDLVLLDIIMPKMNGFEVLKALKADPALKDIKVIMLTNLETSADVEKALELGATTYLVKANYDLEEVIQKVKTLLNAN